MRSDSPPDVRRRSCERKPVKVFLSTHRHSLPKLAIDERHYRSPCTDDYRVLFVLNENTRERRIDRRRESLPRKSAVGRANDRTVAADRNSDLPVFCKVNGVELIALRDRIQPDPA